MSAVDRRSLLLALGAAAVPLPVFAADPWTKDFSEWNEKDIQRIMQDSPWAKNAAVSAGAWKFDGQTISPLTANTGAAPAEFKELCGTYANRPGVDAVQAIAITLATQPAQPAGKNESPPSK